MTQRVAVLISGGGSNMVALVEMMLRSDSATAALVLSNVPAAGGLTKASQRGVPTACVDHTQFADRSTFEAAIHRCMLDAEIDLICLAGFMRILTPGFTHLWAGRMLNIHPSLLPKYPGLNTHARAIAAGDTEAGCSVHQVTADLDMGPVLGQARVPVVLGDTPETLAARVLVAEHRLYPQVLSRVLDGNTAPLFLGPDQG